MSATFAGHLPDTYRTFCVFVRTSYGQFKIMSGALCVCLAIFCAHRFDCEVANASQTNRQRSTFAEASQRTWLCNSVFDLKLAGFAHLCMLAQLISVSRTSLCVQNGSERTYQESCCRAIEQHQRIVWCQARAKAAGSRTAGHCYYYTTQKSSQN